MKKVNADQDLRCEKFWHRRDQDEEIISVILCSGYDVRGEWL